MPTATESLIRDEIAGPVRAIGDGPLTESRLAEHIRPLFSRVLRRDEIYLANHSLGRPLDLTAHEVANALDLWYERMDHAWGPWLEAQTKYRALMARLIGCARPDAVVPKTSAGQGLRAVLNALPTTKPNIVATRGEFDSIDFILKTYAARGRAEISWVGGDARGAFHGRDVAAAITPETDLVMVSQVLFVTGLVLDNLETVIARARECGALVVLDTYHSAGVIDVGFDRLAPDFAIGGNYKYTRGLTGACWLAVHPRHLDKLDDRGEASAGALTTLDTGWFAKRDTFKYERHDTPRLSYGGDAWLESTPPVLTYYQAMGGLELTLALGVDRLRAYSLEQQAILREQLGAHGVQTTALGTHGGYLLVPHSGAMTKSDELRDRGVATDARPCPVTGTGYIRLCPDILTTRDEMERAAQIVGSVMRG
ncbi:MAG: aminotransferase class V-fold PLP-dependent enzyme [Planctomycetota bacterium]